MGKRPECMGSATPQRRRPSQLQNGIFVAIIVFTNTVGNLMLAIGMGKMPGFLATPFLTYIADLLTNPFILTGTGLLIIWMVSQLSMFTWADLTYVLPVTASAYVLTALLSKFFLNESLSIERWIGIGVISLGVMFVSETPVQTHPHEEGAE